MKKRIALLLILILFASLNAQAQTIALQTDPPLYIVESYPDNWESCCDLVDADGNVVQERWADSVYEKKLNFKQDIDVRGMRGDEAIHAVTYFIDDAILLGISRVRILHGTGSGILRTLIRQYLHTVPGVKDFKDEHVQFGGAGITVVDLA